MTTRKPLTEAFTELLKESGVECLDVTITGAGIGFDVKTSDEARKVEALLVSIACLNIKAAHDSELDLWYVVADFPIKK